MPASEEAYAPTFDSEGQEIPHPATLDRAGVVGAVASRGQLSGELDQDYKPEEEGDPSHEERGFTRTEVPDTTVPDHSPDNIKEEEPKPLGLDNEDEA